MPFNIGPGELILILEVLMRAWLAIGVAVASTVAATHLNALVADGDSAHVALTGGFQWALWVCVAIGMGRQGA